LQEVDDCHAVVGGDEDAFGHESFLDEWQQVENLRILARPTRRISFCDVLLWIPAWQDQAAGGNMHFGAKQVKVK
jgi:hypothetical protein